MDNVFTQVERINTGARHAISILVREWEQHFESKWPLLLLYITTSLTASPSPRSPLSVPLSVSAAHVLFISMNWLAAMFMWKKQCKDKEVLLHHGWTARPPPRYSFFRNRENSINLTTSASRPIRAFSVDIPSYPLLQPTKVEEESDSEVPQFHFLLHFLFSLWFLKC